MINIKIELVNGQVFHVKNSLANNVNEWTRRSLSPHGVTMRWHEIIPGTVIQVSNIATITAMTQDEVDALNVPDAEEEIIAENDLGDAEVGVHPLDKTEENGEGDNTTRQERD